jgi:hypothetical protein
MPSEYEFVIARLLVRTRRQCLESTRAAGRRGLQQERVLYPVRGLNARVIAFNNRQIPLREAIARRRRGAVRDWVGGAGLKSNFRHQTLVDAAHELHDRHSAGEWTVASHRGADWELRVGLIEVEPAAEVCVCFSRTRVHERPLVGVILLRRHALSSGVHSPFGEIWDRNDLIPSAAEESIGAEQRDRSITFSAIVL